MKKQRISFYLPSFKGGGVRRMVVNLANLLCENYNVEVVVNSRVGEYYDQLDKRVSVFELRTSRTAFSLRKLIKYINKSKPDVIYSGLEHTSIISIIAKKLASHKFKLLVGVHTNITQLASNSEKYVDRHIIPKLVRVLYKYADCIIPVSYGVAEDLKKHLKDNNSIKVIYNPVIGDHLYQLSKESIDETDIFNTLKHKKKLISVGRLTKAKDYKSMILAFRKLLQTVNDACLIIIGDGEQKEQIQKLIAENNLEEYIILLGFKKNPYKYMKNADGLVLTSIWEGLPTVLIEALALGLPVLSTDCESGPREILKEGKLGYLVNVGDIEDISKGMKKLLEDPIIVKPSEVEQFHEKYIYKEFLGVITR